MQGYTYFTQYIFARSKKRRGISINQSPLGIPVCPRYKREEAQLFSLFVCSIWLAWLLIVGLMHRSSPMRKPHASSVNASTKCNQRRNCCMHAWWVVHCWKIDYNGPCVFLLLSFQARQDRQVCTVNEFKLQTIIGKKNVRGLGRGLIQKIVLPDSWFT